MATVQIKKVIRIGDSLAITLLTQWVKGKVEPGEEMVVIGNGELRIIPVHLTRISCLDSKDEAEIV